MGLRDHGLKTLRPWIPKPNQTFLPFQWKGDFVTAIEANTSYKFDCSFLWLFFLPCLCLFYHEIPHASPCHSGPFLGRDTHQTDAILSPGLSGRAGKAGPLAHSAVPSALPSSHKASMVSSALLPPSESSWVALDETKNQGEMKKKSHSIQTLSSWASLMSLVPWKGLFMVIQGCVLREDKLLQDLVKRSLSHARY